MDADNLYYTNNGKSGAHWIRLNHQRINVGCGIARKRWMDEAVSTKVLPAVFSRTVYNVAKLWMINLNPLTNHAFSG